MTEPTSEVSLRNGRRLRAWILMSLVIGTGFGWVANHLNWTEPIEQRLWTRTIPAPVQVLPDSVIGQIELFVLAGQSNMSGRGSLDAQGRTPVPGAYVFGNDYRWHPAREPIDDTTRQVDLVSRDAVVGVSPARSFAAVLRKARPSRSIGLIPCAKGGSSITQWQPSLRETTLYGSCLKRIQAASTVGQVAGILFFQGETDALSPETTSQPVVGARWDSSFSALVKRWRSDLKRPNLPVVYAQIGSLDAVSSQFSGWTAVQESQRRLDLLKTQMVVTQGLPLQEDGLHYTTEGYRTIGERMAKAYLELTTSSASAPSTESP